MRLQHIGEVLARRDAARIGEPVAKLCERPALAIGVEHTLEFELLLSEDGALCVPLGGDLQEQHRKSLRPHTSIAERAHQVEKHLPGSVGRGLGLGLGVAQGGGHRGVTWQWARRWAR